MLSLGIVAAVLVFDLIWAVLHRDRETTLKEAAAWTTLYVSAAIIFGISLQNWGTQQASKEFFAGWITVYSLSIDNLFIFMVAFSASRWRSKRS